MKWIKTFESFDSIVDEDFFIDSFWDFRDEWDLTQVENPEKSRWSEDFLNNCYWTEFAEPHNKESQFYHLREAFFRFNLSMIVTTNFTNYEMIYDDDAKKILQSRYPELLNSIDSYRKSVETILKDYYGYLCNSSVSTHFRRLFIKCNDGSIERPNVILVGINFRFREAINIEKPEFKVKQMLKQLTFNDEEKRKLKEIGYDLDESIKVKNITSEDVIKTIKGGGRVFATIIKDFPNNDPKEPLTPVSIDDDGLVTVEHDGKEYEVDLENIEKIDIPG